MVRTWNRRRDASERCQRLLHDDGMLQDSASATFALNFRQSAKRMSRRPVGARRHGGTRILAQVLLQRLVSAPEMRYHNRSAADAAAEIKQRVGALAVEERGSSGISWAVTLTSKYLINHFLVDASSALVSRS